MWTSGFILVHGLGLKVSGLEVRAQGFVQGLGCKRYRSCLQRPSELYPEKVRVNGDRPSQPNESDCSSGIIGCIYIYIYIGISVYIYIYIIYIYIYWGYMGIMENK